ncbi:MAG: orotidine-5'-phosphate decarboxylase, partial [Acidobacteria bacterium]|nr:orotidine-5'-phosphate decarboxylase [Acidobacteriota bacterium]
EAVRLGVSLLTVHTVGGGEMLKAAVEGARGSSTRILGVTVLTSHDGASLAETGFGDDLHQTVLRLGSLGIRSGIDGVVASPHEIHSLREHLGSDVLIVTPGIRSAGEASGDQRRTMSASEALDAGADYLVVGRPITKATDPVEAARNIMTGTTSGSGLDVETSA